MAKLRQLESSGVWHTRCAVLMPDHVHVLATLASKCTLSEAVRRFKGPLTLHLRKTKAKWQPGFYDHRVRDDEEVLPVFLYVFLNPYRANLCAIGAKWPGYYCSVEDWRWFGEMTDKACPEPEWLR